MNLSHLPLVGNNEASLGIGPQHPRRLLSSLSIGRKEQNKEGINPSITSLKRLYVNLSIP